MTLRILAAPIAYNEERKIGRVLDRFRPGLVTEVLLVDDGSTDGTPQVARDRGVRVLRHETRRGVGAAIRTVIRHARADGFDILVILAGNDKDRPDEIPRLVAPIVEDRYDLVQGSRYLPGGHYGNMPLYRQFATRFLHPLLFSFLSRRKMTDTTNGFRAMRLTLFDDPRIDLDQAWLDRYELEPYLLLTAIRIGRRVKEIPVTKIYPEAELGYTKMTPLVGWWQILKPLFLVGLGLKK